MSTITMTLKPSALEANAAALACRQAPPRPAMRWRAGAGQPLAAWARASGVVAGHLLLLAGVWAAKRQVPLRVLPQTVSVSLLAASPMFSAPSVARSDARPAVLPPPQRVAAHGLTGPSHPGEPSEAAPPAAEATAQARALTPSWPAFSPPVAALESAPAPSEAPAPKEAPKVASGPKTVPEAALRYRVQPAVQWPRMAQRAGERGRVQLRVVFDRHGLPVDVQLAKSSGHARLDAQAFEAMRVARIVPYLEAGHPVEVVALATLAYDTD
jgi:protein TonB